MTAISTQHKRRGRPKTVDRGHVINEAMHLLWTHGPGVLSINAMCKQMGLSKPSLYREFGSEDQLVADVLAHYYDVRIQPLMVKLCAARPITETIDLLADWLTTPDALPAGCLFAKTRMSVNPLGPATLAQVRRMQARQLEALTDWMHATARRGELALDLAPATAARYIDTQITMLLTLVANAEPAPSLRAQTQIAFAGVMAQYCE